MQPTTLPDNLISKISRLYVDSREFKADGDLVKYDRLCADITLNGEKFTLEFKVDRKDKGLLMAAETIESEKTI